MTDQRIFELRTYYAMPGKLAALHQRFRDHTFELFARHGLELVAFLSATDAPDRDNTVVYLLAYPDREHADRSWEAFRTDPDWIAAKAASEVDGPLVDHLESIYLEPTAESPLK
jgi:hypothetical protein